MVLVFSLEPLMGCPVSTFKWLLLILFFFLSLILAAVVAVSVCVGNCALRAHVISAISRSLIAKLTYEVFAFVAWPRRKC